MDPVEELKQIYGEVQTAREGGRLFFFIPAMAMPPGCKPEAVDVLLCPSERDGYPSRLFFAERVQGPGTRNWNTEARILERRWFAYSWKVPQSDLRPAQLIQAHLRSFR